MTQTATHEAKIAMIADIMREASQAAASPAPAPFSAPAAPHPMHKHGAFDDLQGRLYFLQLAADALKGLGAMMQPGRLDAEQMNQATIMDASAVFRFFGEALNDSANEAYNDMDRLQRAAKGEQV